MAFHILIEVKVRLDDGPYMMLVTGKQMSGTEFPENCPAAKSAGENSPSRGTKRASARLNGGQSGLRLPQRKFVSVGIDPRRQSF
ncbi:hypothetical protein G6L13_21405 [Agrobacterium tumefaciens]|uniref:hypothetical protein n=1 Tax=Agrobacterium tumefaciens TaxID=358 RepID=UPI001571C85D|nr:hypothetical protein [Agrobacterium tumefaciens]NTA83058.1 hypothetical protein [Agrobacterium tumefaciens]